MGIISYAQNFEDVLLNRVFGAMHYAFYVDIGAYHPVDDSVTKTFYDRGWDGINIEPGEIFDELAAARPRDINLNMAVYDRAGEIGFAQHPGWYAGLSHVEESKQATAVPLSGPSVPIRTVPCDTLESILDAYGSRRPIAFMKIDVEGAESAIIRSTNWRTVRPTVLLIEATKPRSNQLDNQSWEPILLEHGYIRAYFDGINCFYVPEERADLLRHFEMPVNVLDGFQQYNLITAQEQTKDAQRELQDVQGQLARMSDEKLRHFEQEAVLKQQLQTSQSQLQAVHAMYVALERGYAERLDHVRREADEATSRSAYAVLREASRLHHLIRELRFPDGPRALRAVLPLARVLRRLMGTPIPAVLPEEAALAALASPAAGLTGGAPLSAPAAIAEPAPAPQRHMLTRRLLRMAARPFRPLARPIAWRTRTFMISPIERQMAQIEQKLHLLLQHIELAGGLPSNQGQAPGKPAVDAANLSAEIKHFGRMLESTLLTLALDHPGPRQ